MDNPYEQPTDELRQVVVAGDAFMGEPKVKHYRVQRKWLVYSPAKAGEPSTSIALRSGSRLVGLNPTPCEEWRDLPIVTEAQVR